MKCNLLNFIPYIHKYKMVATIITTPSLKICFADMRSRPTETEQRKKSMNEQEDWVVR